jgi:hypothetical protein
MTTTETDPAVHAEGRVATAIEQQTAKLPSDVFLWSALGSMGLSLTLRIMGKKLASQFVGQWVPTLLIFGVYDKIVKVAGHDRLHGNSESSNEATSSPF